MKNAVKGACVLLVCIALCGFTKLKHVEGSGSVKASDGNMELSFDNLKSYCSNATSKRFSYNHDTIELPYCTAFRYSGKIDIEKDNKGSYHEVNNMKRLPEDTPFYLRPEVVIKLSITQEQQQHFNVFKNKVFTTVKDTGLRSKIWFELNSVESAMKNNNAVSYIIGVRQLTDLWSKTGQWYSKYE